MVQNGRSGNVMERADSARDGKRVQKVPRGGTQSGWPASAAVTASRTRFPKTAIEEIVRLPFEGHLINALAGYRDVSSHPVRRLPSASAGGSASSCACGRCLLALEQRKKQMRG